MENERGIALFSPKNVVIASVLGGPLGGAFSLAHNHRQVGEPRMARVFYALGIGLLLAAIFGSAVLSSFGIKLNPGVAIGLVAGFWGYAKQRFPVKPDQQAPSLLKLSQITLLGLAFSVGLYFVLVSSPLGPVSDLLLFRYATPSGHAVEYGDGATRQDARQAAEALESIGYFGKTNAPEVRITRITPRPNGLSLDFFPIDMANSGLDESAQELLRDVTTAGVRVVSLRMCSSPWTCEKEYEQPVFGR